MDLNLADAPQRPISLADGRAAKPLVSPAAHRDSFGPDIWKRLLSPILAGQLLSLLRTNDYQTARLYLVPASATDVLASWSPDNPAGETYASIVDAAGQAMKDPVVSARFELGGVMTQLLHARGEALKARRPGTAGEVYYYWYAPPGSP